MNINTKERKELLDYFRLSRYRDGDYMLLEEYDELEDIIKRNNTAKELEEYRYKYITGKINEEEYNEKCDSIFDNIKDSGKTLKKHK